MHLLNNNDRKYNFFSNDGRNLQKRDYGLKLHIAEV